MKKTLRIFAITVLLFVLTGCQNSENNTTNNVVYQKAKNTNKTNTGVATNTVKTEEGPDLEKLDYAASAEKQMSKPEKGEEIATLYIKDYGKVKVKFFKDIAPKAVENFVTHAKNGYYDGLTFHRVIEEFMIQGGDPNGTGTGGESIWGTGFGTEFGDGSLVPYRGSLCMAMSNAPNSIGSQFFITQANYDSLLDTKLKQGGYPDGLIEQYKIHGGAMHLYLGYTVFGQVFEGIEVVDKVAKVTTGAGDKPIADVIIEKIEVTNY